MPIFSGTPILRVYKGSTQLSGVYRGSTSIFTGWTLTSTLTGNITRKDTLENDQFGTPLFNAYIENLSWTLPTEWGFPSNVTTIIIANHGEAYQGGLYISGNSWPSTISASSDLGHFLSNSSHLTVLSVGEDDPDIPGDERRFVGTRTWATYYYITATTGYLQDGFSGLDYNEIETFTKQAISFPAPIYRVGAFPRDITWDRLLDEASVGDEVSVTLNYSGGR